MSKGSNSAMLAFRENDFKLGCSVVKLDANDITDNKSGEVKTFYRATVNNLQIGICDLNVSKEVFDELVEGAFYVLSGEVTVRQTVKKNSERQTEWVAPMFGLNVKSVTPINVSE